MGRLTKAIGHLSEDEISERIRMAKNHGSPRSGWSYCMLRLIRNPPQKLLSMLGLEREPFII